MGAIELLLSVVGVFLGLIGAWPSLSSWGRSAINSHSKRAQEAAKIRKIKGALELSDPSYLVACIARSVVFGFALLGLAALLNPSALASYPLYFKIITAVRLVASLGGGLILGNVTGLCTVVMRHKAKAASSVGG